ncbi:MAG: hypothetical protein ACM31L_03660 [Actinomycetota bacterium]
MFRPLLLCAVALLLAGCPELPQPFRHEGVNSLAAPRLARGVAVRAPDGLAWGPDLAKAVVKRLVASEVPATLSEGGKGAAVLDGTLAAGELRWQLTLPDREQPAVYVQRMPEGLVANADARTINSLASEVVAGLAGPLFDLPDPKAAPRRPTVRLVGPTGLPGDGDKALVQAMRIALEGAGVKVADDAPLVVTGRATLTPVAGGKIAMDLAWTVADGAGASLGSAAQQGVVPADRVAKAWGTLAPDIAAGGADGVLQILRRATPR